MKVELTRHGTLVIGPETPIEEYALARWATDHAANIPEAVLVITDKDVDLIAAAEMNDEETRDIMEDKRAFEALSNGPDTE